MVSEAAAEKPSVVSPTESGAVLSCHDCQKHFFTGNRRIDVLQGVQLAVAPGESISIRGESGSGKTTLLNLLAGLEVADAGEVCWGDFSLKGKRLASLARRRGRYLGMVFQSYYLIPELNARENVLMAARMVGRVGKAEKDRARHLLDRLGLSERMDSQVTQLSGGERQRVAVARALMNQPAVLLADEPTGNLDEATAAVVMEQLLKLVAEERAALVLITHNARHAALVERSLFLRSGRLEPDAPVEAV